MTRYIIKIVDSKGVTKIVYWGNGDGYPEYMGIGILDFLRRTTYLHTLDLRVLNDIKVVTTETETDNTLMKEFVKAKNQNEYPYTIAPFCPHSCGFGLLPLLMYGKISEVVNSSEGEDFDGFYTIDFESRNFTTYYGGITTYHPFEVLPSNEDYLSNFK